jgi:pimeloyl-ACP methyl ester carboxylesterase
MLTKSSLSSSIDGRIKYDRWHYLGQDYRIVFETVGNGSPILLLPAFSTVSSRSEMAGIAKILIDRFQVTVLDWLGFGDSDRPKLDYQPSLYRKLLADFIKDNFDLKITLIAAGHAAGYALEFAKNNPDSIDKLVLIAPTWKGPLKAMGASETIGKNIRNLIRMPLVGQLLYYLNTMPSFLRLMYRRHVYTNSDALTKEFIAQKRQTTQQKGARFAPAAFVTGGLDPVKSRQDFLNLLQSISLPVLTIVAENAPPKSKAEMEAISSLKSNNIQMQRSIGTLGMHEEYGESVGRSILEYLHLG